MASRYLVIVLSTSTANKTIVLFFYISKLVHIFNCCLDKNLPIFTFKSNPPKKNRKTSQKYSLCLCHFSRISSAPGSNSSTYRSNNLFKVKDMEPKSWNTTQIITGWPIRLWQTQHWGCFLVVVRAQLSDDSRKRVLYKRSEIQDHYFLQYSFVWWCSFVRSSVV